MSKLERDRSAKRFALRPGRRIGETVIHDRQTGKRLVLKGYGALKDEYVVRKGIDLAKPIAAQVAKLKSGRPLKSSSSVARNKD